MTKTMSGWDYWEKGMDTEAKSYLKQKEIRDISIIALHSLKDACKVTAKATQS